MTERTATEQAAEYRQTAEAVVAKLGRDPRRGLSAEEAQTSWSVISPSSA